VAPPEGSQREARKLANASAIGAAGEETADDGDDDAPTTGSFKAKMQSKGARGRRSGGTASTVANQPARLQGSNPRELPWRLLLLLLGCDGGVAGS
jgi:hypothetical protein